MDVRNGFLLTGKGRAWPRLQGQKTVLGTLSSSRVTSLLDGGLPRVPGGDGSLPCVPVALGLALGGHGHPTGTCTVPQGPVPLLPLQPMENPSRGSLGCSRFAERPSSPWRVSSAFLPIPYEQN